MVENGDVGRHLTIDLGFLGEGKYEMVSFSDVHRRDGCRREVKSVTGKDAVPLALRSAGGWAARLTKK